MSEFLLSLCAGDHPARLILLVLAQTVVLVAVTLLIAARLSRNAAARHLLLLSAFLAIVVCPILTCVFEAAGVSLAVLPLPSQQAFTPQPVPEPSASFCDFPRERPAPDAEEGLLPSSAIGNDMPTVILQATPVVGEEATSVSWPDRLRAAFSLGLIGWIGGATLRFSGMLLSFYRVCSVIRSAQPITIDNHVCLPGDICRRLRIQHLPIILSSPDVSVPVAVGLLRPAILIPAAIRDQLDGNQWRHILIHETAHILRRDHLCLLLQALIAAIFWVNPLIHVLNRRLVQAREEVCDNYVLAFTNARSYGETLLDLAKLIPPAGRLAFSAGLLGIRWVEALSDEDPATRRQAAEILSLLARRPKKFVPMIVKTLKDQDAVVRRWGIKDAMLRFPFRRWSLPSTMRTHRYASRSCERWGRSTTWRRHLQLPAP